MSNDKIYDLISLMLDYAELICADEYHPGYNRYHIEVGVLGFSISAKKVSGNVANPYWAIRDFSTYNA